jgi:hypothetical protein
MRQPAQLLQLLLTQLLQHLAGVPAQSAFEAFVAPPDQQLHLSAAAVEALMRSGSAGRAWRAMLLTA